MNKYGMEKLTLSRTEALPLTVDELRLWSRLEDIGEEDALLEGLIIAARDTVESLTSRVLCESEIEFTTAFKRCRIDLPAAPIRSVTSVELEDSYGNRITLVEGEDYAVRFTDYVSVVRLFKEQHGKQVIVTVTAGYVTIPQPLKQAIAIHAANTYAGREGQDEGTATIERLVAPYRLQVL